MSLRTIVLILVAGVLLASCGSGPIRRVSPPTASVQELSVHADGSWHLLLRLQNFSNITMAFDGIDAELEIDDQTVGSIKLPIALEIPDSSAEVFEASLIPGPGQRPLSGNFAYRLHGRITSSDPKEDFKFERKSRLSPAPGLPDTWR